MSSSRSFLPSPPRADSSPAHRLLLLLPVLSPALTVLVCHPRPQILVVCLLLLTLPLRSSALPTPRTHMQPLSSPRLLLSCASPPAPSTRSLPCMRCWCVSPSPPNPCCLSSPSHPTPALLSAPHSTHAHAAIHIRAHTHTHTHTRTHTCTHTHGDLVLDPRRISPADMLYT